MKVVNRTDLWIGYRLNIVGIRVWENACQLVAKSGKEWVPIGPRRELPVHVPRSPEELDLAAADPLRQTAYQYMAEQGSDLADLLAKRKNFNLAMLAEDERPKTGKPG